MILTKKKKQTTPHHSRDLKDLRSSCWEFPGGLVVRILGFYCCGLDSVSGWGTEILQILQHGQKKKNKTRSSYFWNWGLRTKYLTKMLLLLLSLRKLTRVLEVLVLRTEDKDQAYIFLNIQYLFIKWKNKLINYWFHLESKPDSKSSINVRTVQEVS